MLKFQMPVRQEDWYQCLKELVLAQKYVMLKEEKEMMKKSGQREIKRKNKMLKRARKGEVQGGGGREDEQGRV